MTAPPHESKDQEIARLRRLLEECQPYVGFLIPLHERVWKELQKPLDIEPHSTVD